MVVPLFLFTMIGLVLGLIILPKKIMYVTIVLVSVDKLFETCIMPKRGIDMGMSEAVKAQIRKIQFELDRQQVQRAMRNAIFNGYYEVAYTSPENVAIDIKEFDSDLEDFELSELVEHIKDLQSNDFLIVLAKEKHGK
jgi:hypothetical protein